MVKLYKGGNTTKVWPIDVPAWLADGWFKSEAEAKAQSEADAKAKAEAEAKAKQKS